MQKEVSPKLIVITLGILVVSFLAAFYVIAWQEPTSAPPGGNVATPLNVSITGQAKEGGLILNTGGAENALIIDKGKSKFGGPLILYPMNRPSPPEEGQMYFDQIDKYLYYFNGTDWVRIGVETITGCGVCRFWDATAGACAPLPAGTKDTYCSTLHYACDGAGNCTAPKTTTAYSPTDMSKSWNVICNGYNRDGCRQTDCYDSYYYGEWFNGRTCNYGTCYDANDQPYLCSICLTSGYYRNIQRCICWDWVYD